MKEFLIHFIGFVIIFAAVGLGRKPDSRYGFFTWQTWVQIFLVTIGVYIATMEII